MIEFQIVALLVAWVASLFTAYSYGATHAYGEWAGVEEARRRIREESY